MGSAGQARAETDVPGDRETAVHWRRALWPAAPRLGRVLDDRPPAQDPPDARAEGSTGTAARRSDQVQAVQAQGGRAAVEAACAPRRRDTATKDARRGAAPGAV